MYAPGTQKLNVEGEVLRWHVNNDTAERVPAASYIDMLEKEVAVLRRQVRTAAAAECAAALHPHLRLITMWHGRLLHQTRRMAPQQRVRCWSI